MEWRRFCTDDGGLASISLDFKDKMSLMLTLEPCFRLHSTLYTENGDQEFEEAWLPIHRAPWDIG